MFWADLLRVIPDAGLPAAEFPRAARISRRAAKIWLGSPCLEVEEIAPRHKHVKLTPPGREMRYRWADLLKAAEQQWCSDVGTDRIDRLRTSLEELVGRLDIELPHYPMIYGPADARVVGGSAVAEKNGRPRIPAHGKDWTPVLRRGGDTVSGLPLHALVSQALVAFTIDYEAQAQYPMARTALAEAVPLHTCLIAELPPSLGAEELRLLERHGLVEVAGRAHQRHVTVTSQGVGIRALHQPALKSATEAWTSIYGGRLVDELHRNLESVDQQRVSAIPDYVLITFPGRFAFGDVSLLTNQERLAQSPEDQD